MAIEIARDPLNLSEFEGKVLMLIKKLLKKHNTFQFDATFIDFCTKEIKCSELDVYYAIYSLVQQKILVSGSTLTRDEILDNSARARILAFIKDQPGIHIRELCKTLNLGNGAARTHLMILENFDFIRIKKYIHPKFVLLFPKDFSEKFDDFFLAVKNENDRHIIECLLTQPLTVTELSTQLDLHHSTIQYHLKKLGDLNLIASTLINQVKKYAINEAKLNDLSNFIKKFFR